LTINKTNSFLKSFYEIKITTLIQDLPSFILVTTFTKDLLQLTNGMMRFDSNL